MVGETLMPSVSIPRNSSDGCQGWDPEVMWPLGGITQFHWWAQRWFSGWPQCLILHCLKAMCQKSWYNSLQQDERNFISPCCFPTTQAHKLGRDEGPQQKNAPNFFNQQNEVSGPKQFLSHCLSARSTFMRPRVNLLTYIHLENITLCRGKPL